MKLLIDFISLFNNHRNVTCAGVNIITLSLHANTFLTIPLFSVGMKVSFNIINPILIS